MSRAASGSSRSFQGGSWYYNPQYAEVSIRYGGVPGDRGSLLGVRFVRRES